MLHTKKGAALVQVLLVTVILAGMTAMLLRVSLSRTNTARRLNNMVVRQMLVNACQAEVNALWGAKKDRVFSEHLNSCYMYGTSREYTCQTKAVEGTNYQVKATFTSEAPDANNQCALTYTITIPD